MTYSFKQNMTDNWKTSTWAVEIPDMETVHHVICNCSKGNSRNGYYSREGGNYSVLEDGRGGGRTVIQKLLYHLHRIRYKALKCEFNKQELYCMRCVTSAPLQKVTVKQVKKIPTQTEDM